MRTTTRRGYACLCAALLCPVMLIVPARSVRAEDFGTKTTKMWSPFVEWRIDNVSYSGNPFDVVAKVTFEHGGSSASHETGMFYDGGSTWKFRFTGTKTGTWTFSTSSSNGSLSGHTGTVNVQSHPGKEGFLRHVGNKYAVQHGDNGELKGYVFNVYQQAKTRSFHDISSIDEYCRNAKNDGFEVCYLMMANNWFNHGTFSHADHNSENPDLQTFAKLDEIITDAYGQGCRIWLWAWGDGGRQWTVEGVGGINGGPDRRLQRYIAARLGPLPGWCMGYGFDLHEYVSKSELRSWANYLHEHMGWQHLLSARSVDLQGSNSINGYAIADNEHGDYSGPGYPDVGTIINHLNSDTDNPHLYEERHYWQRWGLDESKTRRLVWRTIMANGMGGWCGLNSGSYPSSLSRSLRTHHEFWHGNDRFKLDFERANNLTDGYCLKSNNNSRYIVYKEGTSSIQVDLSSAPRSLSAVAVDCKAGYAERNVGPLSPGNHTIDLQGSSDWVVAIGDFGSQPPLDNTPPSAPSNLAATAAGTTRIDLSWDAASDGESGIGGYNIYRDGEKVGTSDNTSYSDEGLSEGTTYKYRVSAVNGDGLEGEKSNEESAVTEAENDTSPPELATVVARSATSVIPSFNEPVTRESAENTDNYEINGGITISAAAFQGDDKSVELAVSTLTEGTTYALTVSNITDRSPNANSGGGRMEFTLSGEIEITNLTAASGKAYEIVEAVSEGDKQFIDRAYTWESLGDYAGMHYIRTANDDADATDESFLSFDINTAAAIYVAYHHGNDLPPWLSSWSRTGDQVCGDGCSDVYEKEFAAGTVTLGGNRPGGAGNMCTVFIGARGAPTGYATSSHPRASRPAPVAVGFSGSTLHITGLRPRDTYTIVLTDPQGRSSIFEQPAGSRGTVAVARAGRSAGVYVVSVRSERHHFSTTTFHFSDRNGF